MIGKLGILSDVFRTTGRLLTFRTTQGELLRLDKQHLLFGLLCTWLAGIGRYWDHPRAHLLQYLGVGSVIYVFVLSLFLWLIIWPLRPQNWSLFNLLTFVSLVSPPALLYAIPVERFFSLDTANEINKWFLAIVATWRVALLIFYLSRSGQLRAFAVALAALLPLVVIIVTLSILNLEQAIFELMAGINRERTANDGSYGILVILSLISQLLFFPIVCLYLILVTEASMKNRKAKQD